MAKTCYFCRGRVGMSGKFITVNNPENSTAKKSGKTLLTLATGYSRNKGFWLCKSCLRNKWDKGEPVHLRFSQGGDIYTFVKR